MGLWSTLTGRDKPSRPQLDSLFALPGVAITLQTAMDVVPTGIGGVCYRKAEGPAFLDAEQQLVAFLDSDEGPDVERRDDGFGFTWLLSRWPPEEMSALVTDLHAVNTSLQDQGFARSLLCSVVGFRTATGAPLGLVYRYTTGTFYPFAPNGGDQAARQRDQLLELQVRTQLAHEMPVEPDVAKWMPLWECPVLAAS